MKDSTFPLQVLAPFAFAQAAVGFPLLSLPDGAPNGLWCKFKTFAPE
jgi:hypothetical protein